MDPLFQVHRLNPDGMAKAEKLAGLFDDLLTEICNLGPAPGRELALAKTHLEQACIYAKKAIAMHTANQES